MPQDRIDKMRQGRTIPQVALQKYNQLRSKNPGKLIFAFEGFDDVAFYDAMFISLVLSRNVAIDSDKVRYFVDNDFDGLKGHPEGADIYCTPSYSFENLLVDKSTLEILLRGEFRCSDENGDVDVSNVLSMFDSRVNEFNHYMRDVNFLIFYARKTGIKISDITEDLKKYVSVRCDKVAPVASKSEFHNLVGYDATPDPVNMAPYGNEFDKLNPRIEWRGKFIFSFFRKFLMDLKEDRGSKSPKHFISRANMSFSPGGDIVRTLASIITVPDCFYNFALGCGLAFPNCVDASL
jgi:hypothetical protein